MTTRITQPDNVPFAPNVNTRQMHFQWRSFFRRLAQRVSNLPAYRVAGLPDPAQAGSGAMIYVSDAMGGAVPAFSDGSDWRRMTDRAIIS